MTAPMPPKAGPRLEVETPDSTLCAAQVSTMPVARPHLAENLKALDRLIERDDPARGYLGIGPRHPILLGTMIPLHDDNPTTLTPIVTVGLIVACAVVFLWQVSLPPGDFERAVYAYGLIPAVLFGERELPAEVAAIPATLSVVTSMFLHAGWLHLIGNMLYLWIFGNNVEDAMGHGRFIVFYLLCGLAAALAQALQNPGSVLPMVGASGAIGGVLGAYILLYPHARVLVLVPLGFFFFTMRIPALIVLGLWFGLQFLNSALAGDQVGGVAYWAHVGGFLAGMALILPFRRKGVRLFAGARHHAAPRRGPRPADKPKDRRATVPPRRPGSRSRLPESGRVPRRRGPWG